MSGDCYGCHEKEIQKSSRPLECSVFWLGCFLLIGDHRFITPSVAVRGARKSGSLSCVETLLFFTTLWTYPIGSIWYVIVLSWALALSLRSPHLLNNVYVYVRVELCPVLSCYRCVKAAWTWYHIGSTFTGQQLPSNFYCTSSMFL